MSRQSALCDREGKVNDLDRVRIGASPRKVDVAYVVRVAVDTRSQHKTAAAEAGYEPDYWARVLSEDRGIVLGRLGQLSTEVQREIVIRWGALLGLQIERREDRDTKESLTALANRLMQLIAEHAQ